LNPRGGVVGHAMKAQDESLSRKNVELQVRDHDVKAEKRGEKRAVFFGGKTDLDILAAQQGVSAVCDFDSLLGDFWPEEGCADQFIATVREWRREGDHKSNSRWPA
jgi:hypothetical protein